VLLYECLTGEVPFRANNYLGIISQVLTHEPAPPSKLRPELGIADAVETVVMRAMEKDRTRRYQTMAELERDLERLLAGDQNVGLAPRAAGVAAPPSPKRWPLLAAAGLAVAIGATVAVGLGGSPPVPTAQPGPPPAPVVPPPAPAPVTPPVIAPPATAAVGPPAQRPAPHKKLRARPESTAAKPGDAATGPAKKAGEMRLPSGSKEAYPDK